jgi:hypothetical protein
MQTLSLLIIRGITVSCFNNYTDKYYFLLVIILRPKQATTIY